MDIFSTLLGFTPEVIREIGNYKNKIKISPSVLNFSNSSEWRNIQPVVVYNETANSIFDVYLILFSPYGENSDFTIEFKNIDPKFDVKLPNGIVVNYQYIIFQSEANGKHFKTVKIAEIKSKTSLTFNIIPKKLKSLKIEAIKFSKAPSSIAEDHEGRKAFSFESIYNVNLKSFSLLLRRE